MKTGITVFALLAAILFYNPCTAAVLTKEDAKKEIERTVTQYLSASFYIDKYVKQNRVSDNLAALKKAGCISMVRSLSHAGTYEIKPALKGLPLFIKEEKNKLFFKVADVDVEIISITGGVPAKDGSKTYDVEYREKITRNYFMEAWGVKHCFDGKAYLSNATFTKTKHGWKVAPRYFN